MLSMYEFKDGQEIPKGYFESGYIDSKNNIWFIDEVGQEEKTYGYGGSELYVNYELVCGDTILEYEHYMGDDTPGFREPRDSFTPHLTIEKFIKENGNV